MDEFSLTRQDIGQFLSTPRQIRAFENIQQNVGVGADFIAGAKESSVLVLSLSSVFLNQRKLTGSANISIADGGPGGDATLDLTDTTVTAGVYGSATQTLAVSVDAKGRITSAQAFALNSDNVAEGAVNLYYTDARSRASVSAGTGLSYDTGTGVIALVTPVSVALGGTGAATAPAALANLGGEPTIAPGTTSQYWRGDKTWQTLGDLGLQSSSAVNITGGTVTGLTNITSASGTIGSGSGSPVFTMNGGVSPAGPYIRFQKAGATVGYVGTDSGINGNSNNHLAIYNSANNILVYPAGTLRGTWSSAGLDIVGALQCDTLRLDATPTAAAVAQTHHVPININGTIYKLLLAT